MRNLMIILAQAGLVFGALGTATSLRAQDILEVMADSAFCTKIPTDIEIVGEYDFTVGPGLMSNGGYSGLISEVVVMQATLLSIEGVLGLQSSDGHLNMTFEADRFYIPEMTSLSQIPHGDGVNLSWTIEELEESMGCKPDEHLPALTGHAKGFVLSEEMRPIDAFLELAIYNIDANGVYALGVVQGEADGMVMQMRVELTPQ